MQIAKIENNEIVAVGEHTQLFPNTSFPHEGANDDFLVENGCVKVVSYIPHNPQTEQLEASSVYLKDGIVYTVKIVEKLVEKVTITEPVTIAETGSATVI